jgi:hypothetical protein
MERSLLRIRRHSADALTLVQGQLHLFVPFRFVRGDSSARLARRAAVCGRGDVSLHDELDDFLEAHWPHGTITGDAEPPGPNGYRLTVACPCGVVFERWVTLVNAAIDLAALARRN